MSTVPNKVIYSMIGVSKYYDKKAVLKDIYRSYFYGAKIGVIGLNGSGKSSLLRILSGVENLGAPTTMEARITLDPGERLACQAVVFGDCEVTTSYW